MRTIAEIDRETKAVRRVLGLINDTIENLKNRQAESMDMLSDLGDEKNDTLKKMLDETKGAQQ